MFMKKLVIMIFLSCAVFPIAAQNKKPNKVQPDKNKKVLIVEASCGECKLGLEGTTCDLAIRLNGKSYFVDGTSIDSHGDAHSKEGFCNAIRKARVQGEIINDRFKASYFQLIPLSEKKRSN